MNPKDFQENALKTESIPAVVKVSYPALMSALDIAVEAANVVDVVKKAVFYGKPVDQEKFAESLRNLAEASLTMRALNRDGFLAAGSGTVVTDDDHKDIRVLHGSIGMFTEAGEMVAAVRNRVSSGDAPLDEVNLCEEMGDSDWYKAILHDTLGVSEEQIRATVIAKLQKRYPGKFTAEAAIDRDVVAEREILEENLA